VRSRQAVEKWAKAMGRTIKDKGYSRSKRPGTGGSPNPGSGGQESETLKQFYPVPAVQLGHPPPGEAVCTEPLPFSRE
jgi:hypothetical protein